MAVFGNGVFGRCLSYEHGAIINGISVLTKETPLELPDPRLPEEGPSQDHTGTVTSSLQPPAWEE